MNTRTILTPATTAMDSLRHEFDRLFDRVTIPGLASSWPTRLLDSMGPHPAANLLEDDDNLYFEAELPNVAPEHLNVNASDHTLSISGTRTLDTPDDATSLRRERSAVRFDRTMRLPVAIEPNNIDARLDGGVLTITLPKAQPARTRRIAVREA